MATPNGKLGTDKAEGKGWGLCRLPFLGGSGAVAGSSSSSNSSVALSLTQNLRLRSSEDGRARRNPGASSVSSVARSLLPTRRRLRLDPTSKLYFPYEPGKQVRSAVRIKNTSKSYVAFKMRMFQMCSPGCILSPGDSIIVTVFEFVEPPENNEMPMDQKSKVKFKIISLKVNGPMEYVPELFDEQKDQVALERILHVNFLDPHQPCALKQLDKSKRQLAEAEAATEARKNRAKERRERYLAQQQVEEVNSV